MKIDTSSLTFFSEHEFHLKNQVTITQETTFANMVDARIAALNAGNATQQTVTGIPTLWLQPVGTDTCQAADLIQAFRQELFRMRRMLEAILDNLNQTGLSGGYLKLKSFDRIYLAGAQQPVFGMYAYETVSRTTVIHHEMENTGFSGNGVVTTLDGRTIDFSLNLNMSRQFIRQDKFVQRQEGYVLIDPLMINLPLQAPEFSKACINFDLDQDGEDETIPVPMQGSGFLSLDLNGDGIINDGSELFGPSTGDGFAELSRYDLDHNDWIDENDPVFDRLTFWEGDGRGGMQLTGIKDAGVGAICLVETPTPFDIKDENNQVIARVKNSGVILNEDSTTGLIQEIDFTA